MFPFAQTLWRFSTPLNLKTLDFGLLLEIRSWVWLAACFWACFSVIAGWSPGFCLCTVSRFWFVGRNRSCQYPSTRFLWIKHKIKQRFATPNAHAYARLIRELRHESSRSSGSETLEPLSQGLGAKLPEVIQNHSNFAILKFGKTIGFASEMC